ncbi:hypothetical protein ACFXHK_26545, partial [Embleya sp. NPDC059267]
MRGVTGLADLPARVADLVPAVVAVVRFACSGRTGPASVVAGPAAGVRAADVAAGVVAGPAARGFPAVVFRAAALPAATCPA